MPEAIRLNLRSQWDVIQHGVVALLGFERAPKSSAMDYLGDLSPWISFSDELSPAFKKETDEMKRSMFIAVLNEQDVNRRPIAPPVGAQNGPLAVMGIG